MRSNATRFIGHSMPAYLPPVPSSTETLSLLTSSATSLTVTVSPPQGHRLIASGSEGYKTRRLQTRLEQAIFFGTAESENPFAFELQPETYEGDLASAALAVSAGILASSESCSFSLFLPVSHAHSRTRAPHELASGSFSRRLCATLEG